MSLGGGIQSTLYIFSSDDHIILTGWHCLYHYEAKCDDVECDEGRMEVLVAGASIFNVGRP